MEASELQIHLTIPLILQVGEAFLFKHTGATNFEELLPTDQVMQKD